MPITQDRMKKLIDAAADFQKHARVLEELGETCQERLRQGLISPLEAFNDLRLGTLRRYALDDFEGANYTLGLEEERYRLTSGRNKATKAWQTRRRREDGVPEAIARKPEARPMERDLPTLPEELTAAQREEISKLMRKTKQGEEE